eukprot:1645675-Rhodomonas_salina.1
MSRHLRALSCGSFAPSLLPACALLLLRASSSLASLSSPCHVADAPHLIQPFHSQNSLCQTSLLHFIVFQMQRPHSLTVLPSGIRRITCPASRYYPPGADQNRAVSGTLAVEPDSAFGLRRLRAPGSLRVPCAPARTQVPKCGSRARQAAAAAFEFCYMRWAGLSKLHAAMRWA